MPIIKIETKINASIDIVFDLSRSIDLHIQSTKQTNETAIAGVTSGLIGLNETVTWRAKHFGIYQQFTSKITAFESPKYFVDEMIDGIFKQFKHEHIFTEENDYTLVVDILHYKSPLGLLGKIADMLFLKSYLTQFIIKRNQSLKKHAESSLK